MKNSVIRNGKQARWPKKVSNFNRRPLHKENNHKQTFDEKLICSTETTRAHVGISKDRLSSESDKAKHSTTDMYESVHMESPTGRFFMEVPKTEEAAASLHDENIIDNHEE